MKRSTAIVAAALAFSLLGGGVTTPADAASDQNKAQELQKKRTFGYRKKGEALLQMKSVLAPVKPKKSSKRPVSTPVTVVLTIEDNSKVGRVCGLGPRISDALLQAWWTKPIERSYLYDASKNKGKTVLSEYRTPEQKIEDDRLLAIINDAIGDPTARVSEILILAGTRRMGGGAITKLPFSSVLGCVELEQKKKEESAKKKAH